MKLMSFPPMVLGVFLRDRQHDRQVTAPSSRPCGYHLTISAAERCYLHKVPLSGDLLRLGHVFHVVTLLVADAGVSSA